MWIILAIIIFVLIVIYATSDDTPESEITAIVEAADSGDPSAKQKLLQRFDNGLTAEKHNEIRRKIYLPKAQNGDANAQYWLGLIAANMNERWRGGRKPLKTETPKPWRDSIGDQTT